MLYGIGVIVCTSTVGFLKCLAMNQDRSGKDEEDEVERLLHGRGVEIEPVEITVQTAN